MIPEELKAWADAARAAGVSRFSVRTSEGIIEMTLGELPAEPAAGGRGRDEERKGWREQVLARRGNYERSTG